MKRGPDVDQFHVTVCPNCAGGVAASRTDSMRRLPSYWIVDVHDGPETTECPRCGKTLEVSRLRSVASSSKREFAADARSRYVAAETSAPSGERVESIDDVPPYPALEERFTSEAKPFADVEADVEAYYDGIKGVWESRMRAERAGNDRALEHADPFGRWAPSDVDADDFTRGAAAPDWPDDDPTFDVVLPGQETPLGDAHLKVGPRVSEWAPALQEQLLDAQARAVRTEIQDALGPAVDSRSPSRALEHLVANCGVTAMGGDYARGLARLAFERIDEEVLEDLKDAERQRRLERLETSHEALRDALRAVATPGGHRAGSVDDLREGAFAALTLAESRPEVVVRFDPAAWVDAKHATAQRALDALRDLARVADVHLVVSSTQLARELSERFDVDEVEFSGAVDAARSGPVQNDAGEGWGQQARAAIDAIDPWQNGYGRVLVNLPDDRWRLQTSLVEDPDVDLSKGGVSAALGVLEAHDLAVRQQDGRRNQWRLTALGEAAVESVDPSDGSLLPRGQACLPVDFTSPPHDFVGAVCGPRRGREGGSPRSTPVEGWVQDTGEAADPHDFVQWLWGPGGRRDKFTAHKRYAAQKRGTLACVDARIREFDDPRIAYLSHIDDEVLVMVQYGNPLATLGRIANALLSSKAFSKLLTRSRLGDEFEQLEDGTGRRLVEDFEASLWELVIKGLQHGWISEDEREWESFRDRIGGVRALCMGKLGELSGSDDYEARGDLLRDLHGLVASATALYEAAGYDLVINVRCPDTANIVDDELRERNFLDFFKYTIPKSALYRSETGAHSHYRQTHETRIDKRKSRLAPGVDEEAAASDPTVSWVVTGRSATELRGSLEAAIDEELAEQVEAGDEAAPYLDVEVTNGNSYAAMKAVVREFAALKNKSVARAGAAQYSRYQQSVERLTRLAIAATGAGDRPTHGNPMALAEGMTFLQSAAGPGNWLTVGDLERAFAHMDPREFLPDCRPAASAFVQAMLASDEPLSRSDLLERTGYKKKAWEDVNRTPESKHGAGDFHALEALGIVQRTTKNGHVARTATLEPWWTSTSPRSEPRGETPESLLSASSTEADIVYEVAMALGADLDPEVFMWPPDVETAYQDLDVQAWRAFIWAAVSSGDEYETGPPDTPTVRDAGTTRLGIPPSTAVLDESQSTIASSAPVEGGAGSIFPKVTDGGSEGGQ